jgi:hypothetical protein
MGVRVRCRHTWYQNESFVYVTFYQRDLKQTDVKVQFEEKEVRMPPNIMAHSESWLPRLHLPVHARTHARTHSST